MTPCKEVKEPPAFSDKTSSKVLSGIVLSTGLPSIRLEPKCLSAIEDQNLKTSTEEVVQMFHWHRSVKTRAVSVSLEISIAPSLGDLPYFEMTSRARVVT